MNSLRKLIKKEISITNLALIIPSNNINIQVFDRNSKLLQRERAAKALDVKIYDYIKDEIGCRLSDRIFDIKRKFNSVLNIGCGRGHVSKFIPKESVNKLILADLSPSWLEQAQATEGIKIEKQILDEETFVLEPNSLDFVISCLSLHWVNNLPGCFRCIINSLKKDGAFMAAIFGADTLYELRGSLQLAELERDGGISPRISPFTHIKDIGALLTDAGFTMLTVDTEELIIGYPSMYELMWDLKGMGESNAARNRKLHLSRDTLFAASAIYNQLYGKIKEKDKSRYIPATFQIIYMIGWKPDESQPKIMKQGTGEISLKDMYRIDEIIKEKQ
ncbi:PREDICTED: NADH dehydrogenase [ubiquinone] 1 alpha subcomplex assembly factor 5 [Ceratosolen solmsi marchali]|uniref:NADH dehydrogenase [ubiquinone] 1 alpha subcomplex assembly factor 5 n=1 Tax=Ceratosolen solmsi marchali TaxID=326594 RepID=A0AAJ7DZW3_9HYME|nr:PREDICTED: NADH dehydrogenase [ubiquinone] 1 alpha subcomplex assembly factor 5 [Ceratosolen solmsi marchali]